MPEEKLLMEIDTFFKDIKSFYYINDRLDEIKKLYNYNFNDFIT